MSYKPYTTAEWELHLLLRRLDTPKLVELTAEALNHATDADDDTLHVHVVALWDHPEPTVFAAACGWCRGDAPIERETGAGVLGLLGAGAEGHPSGYRPFAAPSIELLRSMLDDGDTGVVESAIFALGNLDADSAVARFAELITHPDERIRYALAVALGRLHTPVVTELLIELSADPVAKVRDWATFGLGNIGDQDSVEIRDALWARIDDPDYDTRSEARVGLAKRQDTLIVEVLLKTFRAEDPVVGMMDLEAATELAHPDLHDDLVALRTWWDVDDRLLEEAIAACSRP